jgi:hypothetical protein
MLPLKGINRESILLLIVVCQAGEKKNVFRDFLVTLCPFSIPLFNENVINFFSDLRETLVLMYNRVERYEFILCPCKGWHGFVIGKLGFAGIRSTRGSVIPETSDCRVINQDQFEQR